MNKKSSTCETFVLNIEFKDGSIGSINYFSNGSKGYPKENLEVFTAGKIYKLENYRKLSIWKNNYKKCFKLWKQDKGQSKCVSEFINAIKMGLNSPINVEEIFEVQEAILQII